MTLFAAQQSNGGEWVIKEEKSQSAPPCAPSGAQAAKQYRLPIVNLSISVVFSKKMALLKDKVRENFNRCTQDSNKIRKLDFKKLIFSFYR